MQQQQYFTTLEEFLEKGLCGQHFTAWVNDQVHSCILTVRVLFIHLYLKIELVHTSSRSIKIAVQAFVKKLAIHSLFRSLLQS